MNESKPGDFAGKVAIVTGAASGIGLATAELLPTQGAFVIAEDINPGVCERFANRGGIAPFAGDVALEQTASNVVEFAKKKFGRLDILVNNAASIVYKNTVEMTLKDWNSILQISAMRWSWLVGQKNGSS
jgi:NAD(P)-dependent dehydrogenase (short-subunit alcohol dehydrogenase family)